MLPEFDEETELLDDQGVSLMWWMGHSAELGMATRAGVYVRIMARTTEPY
jgi:hypothetical protein